MADFRSLFRKLVSLKHIKMERGQIWIYGLPAIFITPAAYAGIQKAMIKAMGEKEGGKEIYTIFIEAGKELAKMVENATNKEGLELIRYVTMLSSTGGWGEWKEVYSNYDKSEAIYTLKNFSVPIHMTPRKKPSCNIVRGLVAGVWKYVSKHDVDCIETSCKAQGYPECSFMIGTKKNLEKKHSNLVKEQID